MGTKKTFKIILASTAIILMLLPVIAALNSFLTSVFNQAAWYRPIQRYLVPWEARLVAAALYPLGIKTRIAVGPGRFAFYMIRGTKVMPVDLAWNCLGWQSLLLLIVSLIAGLKERFTSISRIECLVFGLFGTLLVNIFRMTLVGAGIFYINEFFALVLHDYVASLFTLVWLIFFWWFSYSFILEPQDVSKLKRKKLPKQY